MADSKSGWRRVETKEAFLEAFADKLLVGDGVRFSIHADGRISGTAGGGRLSGDWYWKDGLFCRTATLDGEDLGLDCEIVEMHANQMRYTRNKGNGEASIVSIE